LFLALKSGKILLTLATMLASIAVYAHIWGWRFATLFVLLIFVHEMGHVYAAWREGLPVSVPIFIPFMGAVIGMKQSPRDAFTEAKIGYGGPLFGAIGSTIAWGVYYLTGNALFLAVASVSLFVNLFNLIPVSPLDGGRIVTAISPRIWLVGLIGVLAYVVYTIETPDIILILVLVLGGLRLRSQWRIMNTSAYFRVPPQQRMLVSIAYIALLLYLAWGERYTTTLLNAWSVAHGHAASQVI
jgi:Zn-dependent protease